MDQHRTHRLFGPVLAVAVLGASGCPDGGRDRSPQRSASQIVVRDHLGHTVTLPRPARRIASLSPSNTETLFAVGCGDSVVLRDKVSNHPPEATRLPSTNPFNLSPEHVAGFSPDLVLLSHADASRVEALRRLGIPVAVFYPRTLEQVAASVEMMGKLCGAADRAGKLANTLRRQVAAVRKAVAGRPRPTVYIETDGTDPVKPWTAGTDSFVSRMVEAAGGDNVLEGLKKPFVQINAEEILSRDPDVILVMAVAGNVLGRGRELLTARTGWSSLKALKRQNGVVDSIHPDLISRPGPRLVKGLKALARALHPGVL